MKHTTTDFSPETEVILDLAMAQFNNFTTAADLINALKQNYVLIQALIAMQLRTQETLGLGSVDDFLAVLAADGKINYQKWQL